MRSSVILNSANLMFGDDPNAHKRDKVCTVCQKSFSMLGSMKKHFCKFCFRGVCAACSKHSAPDSKGKNVRICDSCYQRAIQDQVRDNLQKDLDKVTQELEEIKKKLAVEKEQRKHESYRRDTLEQKLEEVKLENTSKEKELNEQSERLKKEVKMMEQDIEELTRILATADVERKIKDDKVMGLKQEINLLRNETQSDIDKITDLKRLIEEQEKENENLMKELNSHMEIAGDTDDPLNRTSLIDSLKQKFSQAKEHHKELKKENEGLKKKLAGLQQENSSKKAEIAKIEDGGVRRRSSISKVSTEMKDLEDQIAYQEQEIHRLQEKLNSGVTPK
jgi:DNA repair exonuclease SbcCD ATPase subunit